jgi:hypothetical protein
VAFARCEGSCDRRDPAHLNDIGNGRAGNERDGENTTMNTGSARKPTMRSAARPGGPAVSDRRTCCHSRGGAEKVRPFRAAGASNRRSALTGAQPRERIKPEASQKRACLVGRIRNLAAFPCRNEASSNSRSPRPTSNPHPAIDRSSARPRCSRPQLRRFQDRSCRPGRRCADPHQVPQLGHVFRLVQVQQRR